MNPRPFTSAEKYEKTLKTASEYEEDGEVEMAINLLRQAKRYTTDSGEIRVVNEWIERLENGSQVEDD